MSCQNGTSTLLEGIPNYENKSSENVIRISAWCSPVPAGIKDNNPSFITEEQYQYLEDSGLNTIYGLYERGKPNVMKQACELAAKHNIKYFPYDPDIFADPKALEWEKGDLIALPGPKAYKDLEGYYGNLVTDEPGASQFQKIANFKKFYNDELPGKDFYVNLFPTYATTAQLETDSYEEYIRKYIEIVKPDYVSYDHYALMEDGYGVKKITDDVLYNLEIVAKLCKEANIPMMTFVSTMCYGLGTREPWSVEEIRWQVMNELAYGSIGIQYFCYFTPLGAFTDECIAMIDHSGNRTDVYYDVQEVNRQILKLDEAYLDFKWETTKLISGSTMKDTNKAFKLCNNDTSKFMNLESVEGTLDTLVGCFTSKTEEGREAYMITNFSEPTQNINDEVSVKINGAKGALVYINGEAKVVKANNGKFDLTIDPGNGAFLIPYK